MWVLPVAQPPVPQKGHHVLIDAHISWKLKIVPKEPKPSFPVTHISQRQALFLFLVMLDLRISS